MKPVDKNEVFSVRGADVSWLPQMEAQGVVFYDDAGVRKNCLQILKEHGMTGKHIDNR